MFLWTVSNFVNSQQESASSILTFRTDFWWMWTKKCWIFSSAQNINLKYPLHKHGSILGILVAFKKLYTSEFIFSNVFKYLYVLFFIYFGRGGCGKNIMF